MIEEKKLFFSSVLIGDAVTEKTSIREQLGEIEPLDITFTGPFTLISHELKIKRQIIQIRLWTMDSSSVSWEKIRETYYRDVRGAIIIFDSTEENWFNNLKFWIKEIKRANSKITMVLVHNLIEKEENDSNQIKEIIAEKIFKRYKVKFSFIELRTITNKKVEEIYLKLCKKLLEKNEEA
ncbi:MAG: hypothetical protein FK733_07615 [Asgard group archaeon]|nr:hypothetical protein [Asgard group archaeon]